MDIVKSLQDCCTNLCSTKITDRKKGADALENILDNAKAIKLLNEEKAPVSWNDIVTSVHLHLVKESDKLEENQLKKINRKKTSVDLLVQAVQKANTGDVRLNVANLVQYVIQCFESSNLIKYYFNNYIIILKDYILSQPRYLGCIADEDWITLLSTLQKTALQAKFEDAKIAECIKLIFESGPKHRLPLLYFRNQFDFVGKLCENLDKSLPTRYKAEVIQIVTNFCMYNAADCRMSCCKLGEEVFLKLHGLYERIGGDDCVKELFFEFCLLQLRLHHPHGATGDSTEAYAYNWTAWRKQLRMIYRIVEDELSYHSKCTAKPQFFYQQNNTFLLLAIAVCKQIFSNEADVGICSNESSTSILDVSQSSKRLRVDIGLKQFLCCIKQSKSYLWIYVLSELLKVHPEVINFDQSVELLEILLNLHKEVKSIDMQRCIYECITSLVGVQSSMPQCKVSGVDEQWNFICDEMLRSLAHHQKANSIHTLLQALISNGKIRDPSIIYQTFLSGALTLENCTLKTLSVTAKYFGVPDTLNGESFKKKIIKWMTHYDENNTKIFIGDELLFAQTLISLCLKQWPQRIQHSDRHVKMDFEDVFVLNSFQKLVLPHVASIGTQQSISISFHKDISLYLVDGVKELLSHFTSVRYDLSYLLNSLSIVTLTGCILSKAIAFDTYDNVETFIKKFCIEEIFESINEILYYYCSDCSNIKDKSFNDALKSLNHLFMKEFYPLICKKYRTFISIKLLSRFFELLNYSNDEETEKDIVKNTKQVIVKILCNFSMYKGSENTTENESKVIEGLAQLEEYDMIIIVWSSVKHCQPGVLNEEVLALIVESLCRIWMDHSSEFKTALKVIELCHSLVRHIGNCTLDHLNKQYYGLLTEIYTHHGKYGYEISIALLNTFQFIFMSNFYINYKRYTHSCISQYICNFLKSNYQLVRIKAIECLVEIFSRSFSDPSAQSFQKSICGCINLTCREVFTIEENLNSERRIDETVSRTCSVFQTYATLIVCNSAWRKDFLYSLLALTQDKELNLDLLTKALSLVALKLGYTSIDMFIGEHVNFLLPQWFANQRALSSFPYEIAGCESQLQFYRKYMKIIIPLQLSRNIQETDIFRDLDLPGKTIIDTCFVELVTSCFLRMGTKLPNSKEYNSGKDLYCRMCDEVSERNVQELLITEIDKILINIMTSLVDEKLYEKQFDTEYVLQCNEYSGSYISEVLSVIKIKAAIKSDILEYCVNMQTGKIQLIMLELALNVYTAPTTLDKLKSLHQYLNFIDIITPFIINPTCKMLDFCIQSIIHTVLYFIEMKCDTKSFNSAACHYLQAFVKLTISNCHEKLEKHFSILVNKLVLLIHDETLSQKSIAILKMLVVDNAALFKNIIPQLDPLPPISELMDINCVYKQLCTQKWGTSLVGEIKHFLEAGNSMNLSRLEALKHLKHTLAEDKTELQELFEVSSKVRDFSEERKKSVLHQLICVLVKLISADSKKVNIEAARCLGEIGASNLTTLILQSEDMDVDQKSSPIQLLTSHMIMFLYQSIADPNIHIVKNSSLVLYEVLSTKEGQHFINNSRNKLDVAYLHPFLPKNQKLRSALVPISKKDKHADMVNDSTIWRYTDDNHNMWITNLVCTFLCCLSEISYLQSLIPLCKINVAICEKLFPYVVHLYASMNESNIDVLCKWIDYFFEWDVWDLSTTGHTMNTSKIQSAQCMLDAVLFCRIHIKSLQPDIQLNYLKVAQAAFYCSRFFDAIFYVELWCQSTAENIERIKKFTGSPLSLFDLVCAGESSSICLTAQNILRQSYSAIGEVDGLNGCGHAHLLDTSTRIDHYKQLGRWDQVVLHYDTLLSRGELNVNQDFSEALKNCGYYGLSMNYQEVNTPDYDTYWRLGRYDCDTRQQTENPYEKHKYVALKSLFEKDKDMFSLAISDARLAVIDSCKGINLQTTKALYRILTNLQMLQELEDMDMGFSKVKEKWEKQDSIPKLDFKSCEPIKAQRIALLTGYLKSPDFSDYINGHKCKEYLANLYLDLAASAREEKHFNIAKRAITSLSEITELKQEYSYKKVLEEAQICWAMKDKVTARYLIHELFTKNNNIKLNFVSLKLYGQWMAEAQSENPRTILNTYFLEPLNLIKSVEEDREDLDYICETYYDIARFSDLEYQRIRSYVKSTAFEQKVHNKKKSKEAAERIKSQAGRRLDDDQRRAANIYNKQSIIDEVEINNTLKERGVYFILAIKYYMLNLQYSDANKTRIFRVLSLWLENRNSDELKKLLDDYVPKIPSYKFVSILPQLVPHLSNNAKDIFANHIASIIERCAKDHPHHTLPILLSLANSNMDEEYAKINAITDSNEVRVEGAQKLLNKLKSESVLNNIITEMQLVSTALVELAYLDRDKCRAGRGNNSYVIPNNTKINNLRNLSKSYLPTISVEIRKDCQYNDVISVHSFKAEFMGVGGINCPKSILCQCSNGIMKQILVKGKDDLRQDAVMEQVFTIMNDLFSKNKHTSKLLIRTYKVVPLSKRSGIIEWVENSNVFHAILLHLHSKYRPHDWSFGKCYTKIQAISTESREAKERVFKEVCANFMPVMHKFFEEQYPHPSVWYERRRAYTHSLATTSMCGYVLGLGDRYCVNILLDENSAEVIHIDFGIAFEQGKLLRTPETVPFRLTRDLEDGMGAMGVNGIFRRSCEKTMEVLRHNWETIISILEVLLYDPLYAWAITPAEAYSHQNYGDNTPRGAMGFGSDDKVNLNVSAERALLRLHQKLHGTEEGGSSSVEGQVEKLIQQARDLSNLSRLFYGWQAYL